MTPEKRKEIAQKGGLALVEKRGRDYFKAIGKQGGLNNIKKHGKEQMTRIRKVLSSS